MMGIINVNKPQDFTSHDVVAVMRKLCGVKKIGHTGTLDPMATGVLVVCIGKVTRVIEYMDGHGKEYLCRVRLGIRTDTYDVWGKTLEKKDTAGITKEMIENALSKFRGKIEQQPPLYSALKVNGRKLYEYARAGQDVEIKKRKVTISDIRLIDLYGSEAVIYVKCSGGTYIRSICHDLGKMLGCGAAMSALERTASGPFRIGDAVPLSELRAMEEDEIEKLLLPADYPLSDFGKIFLESGQANGLIDGKRIEFSPEQIGKETEKAEKYCVYSNGRFIGVADRTKDTQLKADKIFCTEKL